MRGMIMAAGEGTRLRPLTYARPKALVPVLTVPIMENIIRWLKKAGITELAVNLHYKGNDIESYFGDGSRLGVSIAYLHEDKPHGTAGAVRLMSDFLKEPNDTILVVGCDELIDLDLREMIRFHKERNALVTISLAQVTDPREFGVAQLDGEGRIVGFIEKPKNWTGGRALVNSGVYLIEPEVLDRIPYGGVYDFGKQLFPELVAEGAPIYGFASDGYWNDIGHIGNYWEANKSALEKRAPIHDFPLEEVRPGVFVHPTAQIAENARIEPPCAIGANTVVGENACIRDGSIVGDHCVISESAVVEGSILWSNVTVTSLTVLCDCIVTDNCIVHSPDHLIQQAIIVSRK
ncbi:MAG: NDP-sugar synthase [Armatimonadetes bacterium]|nr:NDP-sugar synthase [Armatimonadota bacterium]MCX7967268.1 NDP-sugar synthase [Armatimonadota bacterium]MDW8141924.1 NDP-sugar synthase [Armatimonadota bacterium]